MKKTNIPSPDALENFASELDLLAAQTRKKIGQSDARYIRRLIGVQRLIEIAGRVTLVLGFIHPAFWILGVACLALSKILDNMEIGHNILHGQYDWMNDPYINSRNFEWDIVCDSESWKRYHNHVHHTYTNIIGKDRDYGYGLLRLSNDVRWKPKNRFQLFTYVIFSSLFEWGVAYHELAGERIFLRKKRKSRRLTRKQAEMKRAFFKKIGRQVFKDYIFFPLLSASLLLSWTVALQVLLGNLIANLIRNWWTSTVIFCGHFTEEAQTFRESVCKDESQGHWYYRQILGSSNFTGSKLLHILTGHLSYQIEHHLFPDIPAPHYREIAPTVQKICEKYDIPYNSYSFAHQYMTVLKRIFVYSKRKSYKNKVAPV